MAKKVILKDQDNIEIMPITRGELITDSSGNQAFHSNQFLATQSQPGLMSTEDKTKLDIVKFMGEMVKHSGDAKAVINDKSFAKRTSLNLNDIRNALNDGNDGDSYTVKKN